MSWQPIETAPKDGSNLWLWSDEGQFQGSWKKLIRVADGKDLSYWGPLVLSSHGCGCCGSEDPRVTHWMPLPAPPLEGAK